MNDNELGVAHKYIDEGWTLIRGGAPDFMFVKSQDDRITDVLFVEVKMPSDPLTFEQATYRRVIEEFLKAEYKLEVVATNESFSKQTTPNRPRPFHSTPTQPKPGQATPDHACPVQSEPLR